MQVLREDTGLENISELISLMEGHNLWKSSAVYRHDDDGRPRSNDDDDDDDDCIEGCA